MVVFDVAGYERIICEKATLPKGSFVAGSGKVEVSGLYIEYSSCHLSSAEASCKVDPIVVDGAEGNGKGPGLSAKLTSTAALTLEGAGSGHRWTVIEIESKAGHTCELAGPEIVLGEAKCELSNSTAEAIKHALACSVSGSDVKRMNKAAEFALTEEIGLTSGKEWSLQRI